jgi:hypothetical protein
LSHFENAKLKANLTKTDENLKIGYKKKETITNLGLSQIRKSKKKKIKPKACKSKNKTKIHL